MTSETVPIAEKEWSSVRLKPSTLSRYKVYGRKGENYDSVFLRIINALENNVKAKRIRAEMGIQ